MTMGVNVTFGLDTRKWLGLPYDESGGEAITRTSPHATLPSNNS
jgi:hypothetical protein